MAQWVELEVGGPGRERARGQGEGLQNGAGPEDGSEFVLFYLVHLQCL